jgi:hypothetical protein
MLFDSIGMQQLHVTSVTSTANVRNDPPLDRLKLQSEFKFPVTVLSLIVRRSKPFAASSDGGMNSPDNKLLCRTNSFIHGFTSPFGMDPDSSFVFKIKDIKWCFVSRYLVPLDVPTEVYSGGLGIVPFILLFDKSK